MCRNQNQSGARQTALPQWYEDIAPRLMNTEEVFLCAHPCRAHTMDLMKAFDDKRIQICLYMRNIIPGTDALLCGRR